MLFRSLEKGDTYTSYPSGGGGWGDPLDRDPEEVRKDVRNGIVTVESDESIYGVVFKDTERFEIDGKKTSGLRSERRNTP